MALLGYKHHTKAKNVYLYYNLSKKSDDTKTNHTAINPSSLRQTDTDQNQEQKNPTSKMEFNAKQEMITW